MKEFPLFLTPYFTISPLEVYVLCDQCDLLLRRRHEAPHFDKFHLFNFCPKAIAVTTAVVTTAATAVAAATTVAATEYWIIMMLSQYCCCYY